MTPPARHRASHFHVRVIDGVPLTSTQAAVLAFARTLPADDPPIRYTDAAQRIGGGIDRRTVRSCVVRLRELGFAEADRLGLVPPAPLGKTVSEARHDDGVTVHPDPPEEVVAEVRRRRDRIRDRAEVKFRNGHPRAGIVELPARVHRVSPATVSRRGRAIA